MNEEEPEEPTPKIHTMSCIQKRKMLKDKELAEFNQMTNTLFDVEEIVNEVKDKVEHEIHMKDVVKTRRIPFAVQTSIGNTRMTVINKFITQDSKKDEDKRPYNRVPTHRKTTYEKH